jgi:uncharacterized membrane protein YfcA
MDAPAFVRFLNNSNIFVAIGAACISAESFILTEESLSLPLVAQCFFLTWCAYLFLKEYDSKLKKPMMIIALIGAILSSSWTMTWEDAPLLLLPILIVLLYKTELYSTSRISIRFSLRKSILLKPLAIATCWTYVTSIVCGSYLHYTNDGAYTPMILANFIYILALAIAGDIRDVSIDSTQLKTIASRLGIAKTKSLCVLMVVISFLIITLDTPAGDSTRQILIYGIIHMITSASIARIDQKRDWHWQTLLMDGLLMLRIL